MPRTGRPPTEGAPKDEMICVRFPADLSKAMDASRDTLDRSGFIRQAVKEKIERGQQ